MWLRNSLQKSSSGPRQSVTMGEIHMTRDFYLWSMSVIYLFAFSSLFVQIPGKFSNSSFPNCCLPVSLALLRLGALQLFWAFYIYNVCPCLPTSIIPLCPLNYTKQIVFCTITWYFYKREKNGTTCSLSYR